MLREQVRKAQARKVRQERELEQTKQMLLFLEGELNGVSKPDVPKR